MNKMLVGLIIILSISGCATKTINERIACDLYEQHYTMLELVYALDTSDECNHDKILDELNSSGTFDHLRYPDISEEDLEKLKGYCGF